MANQAGLVYLGGQVEIEKKILKRKISLTYLSIFFSISNAISILPRVLQGPPARELPLVVAGHEPPAAGKEERRMWKRKRKGDGRKEKVFSVSN